MISNGERWHYLAVKKLLGLLKRITSKQKSDFYCLNYLHSFRTNNTLELHKRESENKDFCSIFMPSEDTKTLEFNQSSKSDEASFIIYADLKCLIDKIDGCESNPENSFITKVGEHIPSGFLVSTISSFKSIEIKHDVQRGKDCAKNLKINI